MQILATVDKARGSPLVTDLVRSGRGAGQVGGADSGHEVSEAPMVVGHVVGH